MWMGVIDTLTLTLVVTGAIVGVGMVIMGQMNTSIYQVLNASQIPLPGAASVVVVVFIGVLVINYLGGFRRNAGKGWV